VYFSLPSFLTAVHVSETRLMSGAISSQVCNS